jgi:hypothetical protein
MLDMHLMPVPPCCAASAPPYPPSRLRKGHALVLLPDSETSSASTIRVKEVIWDDAHAAPDAPASWWESGEYESPAHVIF